MQQGTLPLRVFPIFLSAFMLYVVLASCKKNNGCDSITCKNGGVCEQAKCTCPSGWTGDDCGTSTTSGGGGGGSDTVYFTVSGVSFSRGEINSVTYKSAYATSDVSAIQGHQVSNYGHCWSNTNRLPTKADKYEAYGPMPSPKFFNTLMDSLEASTTYYVRTFVTIDGADFYHDKAVAFTTQPPQPPLFSSTSVSAITIASAQVQSGINDLGSYIITDYGICYGTVPTPDITGTKTSHGPLSSAIQFPEVLSGLTEYTTYYVRPYAKASTGSIFYGVQESFKTASRIAVRDGLQAYYNFDGQSAADSVNVYHGVSNGNSYVADDPRGIGFCASLTASSYINVPFNISSFGYSFSLWLRSTDATGNIVGGQTAEISLYNSKIYWRSGRSFDNNLSSSLLNGLWNHVVLINDVSTNTVKYYINGALQEQKSETYHSLNWPTGFYMGACVNLGSPDPCLSGKLDNVRIYNRPLSASEIVTIYNSEH